ncbi:hypothetical protein [Curtobacterium flaccumfaciens]|uniref:hypothetical protein n=1 Tax=Curtobacterium flaccumfaciens TaxID=2035 RepID=UPI003D9A9F5D
MASNDDGFTSFDDHLNAKVGLSPWLDGRFLPDLDLLRKLVSLPVSQGESQETGRPAKAFDAWIANEIRRAGFKADEVWPRASRPRVLPAGMSAVEEKIAVLLDAFHQSETMSGTRLQPRELRSALRDLEDVSLGPSSASILGDFYSKQVDVGISSWDRGPEVIISTKTMFSGYGKNLRNRHEEAVGEVSSLRRRHPMCAMGYAYMARQTILDSPRIYNSLIDILLRLRRTGEAFDATMLILVDWDDDHPEQGLTYFDQPVEELSAASFFTTIIEAVVDRSPSYLHEQVRVKHGGLPVGGLSPDDDDDDEAFGFVED